MAYPEEYIKYAAGSERRGMKPMNQPGFNASNQVIGAMNNQVPGENMAQSYQGLGIKPAAPRPQKVANVMQASMETLPDTGYNLAQTAFGPQGTEAIKSGLGGAYNTLQGLGRSAMGGVNNVYNQSGQNLNESLDNIRLAKQGYGAVGGLVSGALEAGRLVGKGIGSMLPNAQDWNQFQAGVNGMFGVNAAPNSSAMQPTAQSQQQNQSQQLGGRLQNELNQLQPAQYNQRFLNAQNINSAMDNMARANGGEAVSQGKGGSIRYVKDANGNIIRSNAATGEMAPLQSRVTSSVNNGQPSPFWQNMGYPGGVEQYRQSQAAQQQQAMQQAQYNQLLDIALNGGASGDMSPAEFGAAKRRQKMAMGALGMLNDSQRDNARLSQQDRQFGMNYGLQMANADASRQQAINERADKQRDYGLREQQFMLERQKYMNPQDEFGMTPEGKMYAKKGNTAKQNYQDMKAFEQQSSVAGRILANPDRYTPEQVADAKLVLREWADQGYGDYTEED